MPPFPFLSYRIIEEIDKLYTNNRDKYCALGLLGFIAHTVFILREGKNSKFSISTKFWIAVMGGRRFKDVFYPLKKSKILITDEYFEKGKRCKRYSLAPEFRKKEDFFYYEKFQDLLKNKKGEIHYDFNFYEKLEKTIEKWKEKLPEGIKSYRNHYIENISQVSLNSKVWEEFEQRRPEFTPTELHYAKSSIENIQNKKINSTIHVETGRQFNNITNMPRWIRKYLELNGESFVEIDAEQCQITLLASFYSDSEIDFVEKAKFLEFLSKERAYDYYNARLKNPIARDSDENKEKIKRKFLTPLFGKQNLHNSETFKLFAADFPRLCQIIEQLKLEDHADFSILLQRAEANLFVRGVFKTCCKQGLYILTIHDGVLCLKENMSKVIEIITEEYKKAIGFRPKLKIKC